MPNMYARGILFGKMVIELGDTCTARCEKLGMTADIEFRTKVHHPSVLLSSALCDVFGSRVSFLAYIMLSEDV